MKEYVLNAILTVLVSFAVVYGYDNFLKEKKVFVSIDVEGIIKEKQKSYRERLKYVKSAEEMAAIHNESVQFSDTLYKSVKQYGLDNNAIIFQSSALLSGETKDITNEVISAIK